MMTFEEWFEKRFKYMVETVRLNDKEEMLGFIRQMTEEAWDASAKHGPIKLGYGPRPIQDKDLGELPPIGDVIDEELFGK